MRQCRLYSEREGPRGMEGGPDFMFGVEEDGVSQMYPDFLGNWEVIQENYKWFRVTLTFKKGKGGSLPWAALQMNSTLSFCH